MVLQEWLDNMDKNGYLIIAIIVIVTLLAIFVISFVVNKKTPVPKGCEDLKVSDEKCQACNNTSCRYHKEPDVTEDNK